MIPELNRHLGVTYNLKVIRNGDPEQVEEYQAKNILTHAFNRWTGYTGIKEIMVGSGTTTPTLDDLGLETQVASFVLGQYGTQFTSRRTILHTDDAYAEEHYSNYNHSLGTGRSDTIAEIGMSGIPLKTSSSSPQTGVFMSRALITDGAGTPTPIVLTPFDELIIARVGLKMKVSGLDARWTNTVDVDGVQQSVEFRFVNKSELAVTNSSTPAGTTDTFGGDWYYLGSYQSLYLATGLTVSSNLVAKSSGGTFKYLTGGSRITHNHGKSNEGKIWSDSVITRTTNIGGAEGTWDQLVFTVSTSSNHQPRPIAVGTLTTPVTFTELETVETTHQSLMTGMHRIADEDMTGLVDTVAGVNWGYHIIA